MPDDVYDVKSAAKYLRLSVAAVKYHLYVVKDLSPDGKVGRSPWFSQETLDTFLKHKRKPGRPKREG